MEVPGVLCCLLFVLANFHGAESARPLFQQGAYLRTLKENVPKGTQVGAAVHAVDPDPGTVLTYSLVGDTFGVFDIDGVSGRITTIATVDYETKTSYMFQVYVVDEITTLPSKAFVFVYISNVNEFAPVFQGTPYGPVPVPETVPRGTVVTTIRATDGDANDFVEYFITGGVGSEKFNIVGHSGVITTNGSFDFLKQPQYVLQVTAKDTPLDPPRRVGTGTVTVNIQDIDTLDPVFAPTSYAVSISESLTVNSVVANLTCVDPDPVAQNALNYTLASSPDGAYFDVNRLSGQVFLKQPVDYEKPADRSLTFNVLCMQIRGLRAGAAYSANAMVTVNVKDFNDSPPKFTKPLYNLTVDELTAIGTNVLTLSATDLDTFPFNEFAFELVPGKEINRDFRVVGSELQVARTLDYERQGEGGKFYDFYVKVTQINVLPPAGSDMARVLVTVTDANDNRPVFKKRLYGGTQNENTMAGTSIVKVEATDLDTGSFATIRYNITAGNTNDALKIDRVTGVISNSYMLDYERQRLYTLTVEAEDQAKTLARRDSVTVTIGLVDENDNSPVWQSGTSMYTASVTENSAAGVTLLSILATDADDNSNGQVRYDFKPDSTAFAVSATGVVTTLKALDFETNPVYNLTIVASDRGIPARRNETTLIVTVLDANDNSPVFVGTPFVRSVAENQTVGTFLGPAILATDADSGTFGEVEYIITGAMSANFRMDSATGNLTTAKVLDYEDKAVPSHVYSLQVTARDKAAGSPRATTTVLTIMVTDVNDNPPNFVSTQLSQTVLESANVGTVIDTLSVTDADTLASATATTFAFLNTSFSDQFSIGPTSGQITLKKRLDYEAGHRVITLPFQAYNTLDTSMRTSVPAVVTVNVQNVNDHCPHFVKHTYAQAVPENTTLLGFVLQVMAVDLDAGFTLTYTIPPVSVTNKFAATFRMGTDGRLVTVSPLDYETTKTYNTQVTVSDGTTGCPLNTSNILISILDSNDNNPIFTAATANQKTTVRENSPLSTSIFTVTATDRDSGAYGQVSYSIKGGNAGGAFTIDSNTGEVSVVVVPDYEASPNVYNLLIEASDLDQVAASRRTNTTTLQITVTDENDNSPVFSRSVYTPNPVDEDKSANSVVTTVSATDRDSSLNGNNKIVFQIVSGDGGAFKIDSATGLIQLARTLDRETVGSYNLGIMASDSGSPVNNDTAQVLITVRDVNDNPPHFLKSIYLATILENASLAATLQVQVNATDDDQGLNGQLEYSIPAQNSGNIGQAWKIHPDTGVITTQEPLDRETTATYSLTIQVKDRGTVAQTATALVVITVGDINDNAPMFAGLPYHPSVAELLPAGQSLLTLVGTDADAGPLNNKLVYSLSGPNAPLFRLDQTTRVISTNAPLDYAINGPFTTVTVTVRDEGVPSLSSDIALNVTVVDQNNNAPVFTGAPFPPQRIREDQRVGFEVFRFTATDADAPNTPNSQLSFSLTNDQGKFTLASLTGSGGRVVLENPLDFESLGHYVLKLHAEDNGSPRRRTTTDLNVTVVDANDSPPVFQQSTYTAAPVKENRTTAAPLVTVKATDADFASNARVTYSLKGGDISFFLIDNITGLVTTNPLMPMNYEVAAQRTLSVTVGAEDGGTPTMTASCQVHVVVTDINDNPPNFDRPTFIADIREDSKVGLTVVQAGATDVDGPFLSYSLAASSPYFTISSTTGAITTKAALPTFESTPVHTLTAVVTDGLFNATATVRVNIENRNTHPPVFYPHNYYKAGTVESSTGPTPIVTVFANDSDTGAGGTIEYRITSGSLVLFQIGVTTGIVSLKGGVSLDRETTARHLLSISATDKGSSVQLSASCTVEINVLDVNDKPPVFNFAMYSGRVRENSSVSLPVATFAASDMDVGINAEVLYSITAGNVGNVFQIANASAGLISTVPNKLLDREVTPLYSLTVTASGRGTPPLTDTTRVNVTVADVNDNPPVFTKNVYPVKIAENIRGGVTILKVSSTDADIGTNANAFYSIVSVSPASPAGMDDPFKMTADGVLQTSSQIFDREKIPVYTITIQVMDGIATTTPRFTDTALVMVTLLDINDNSPTFIHAPYSRTVEESNATRDAVIETVSATDPDLELNRTIQFAFAKPTSQFTIDPVTGEVRVVGTLDREAAGLTLTSQGYGLITLTIVAFDRNTTAINMYPLVRNSTTTLTVTITDANDNQPIFEKVTLTPHIAETSNIGTVFLTVTATDRDLGNNAAIAYNISAGNKGDYFAINSKTGAISIRKTLDAEYVSFYILTVKAEDQNGAGIGVLSSTVPVHITVTDINEHPPAFKQRIYRGAVFENSPVATGTGVTVAAVDIDLLPANKNIMYNISAGNTLGSFFVHPRTGVITTVRAIDRETTPSFTMTFVANDNGTPPLTGLCQVIITIEDLNDNSPVLSQSAYTVGVVENTGPSIPVKVSPAIAATDADAGVNKEVNFTLSGTGSDQFRLDATTGRLYTANDSALGLPSLDRERVDSYSLTVVATDGGGRTDTATVTVTVLDDNDNPPTFAQSLYRMPDTIESTAVGTELFTVSASDSDSPTSANTAIHYTIVDGGRGHFTIGFTSGIISLAASLDRELESNYTLNISGTDGGLKPLHNYTTVVLEVLDANDNPPILRPTSSYAVVIPENIAITSTVSRLTATDADIMRNGQVSFGPRNDDDSGLAIDPLSGYIFTTKRLNYEVRQHYTVHFTATDHGSPPFVTNATLDVTVEDQNDNAPMFTASVYKASFPETTMPPAQLLHFIATDKDSGINAVVGYYLEGNQTFFAIDNVTGIVRLLQPVSADAGFTHFTLVVVARDLGTPPLETKTTATITVTDINSNAPVFNTTSYVSYVLEEDQSRALAITVAAYELDRDGKTQPITYGLLLNVGNYFAIDAHSGRVTAVTVLDREVRSVYSLTVVATDGVHNSTAIITVYVADINDNAPKLPFGTLTRDIYENRPNGTVVVPTSLITGTDADAGLNALLTYEITGTGNVDGAFACDNTTGEITVSNNIDRETRNKYILEVEANDNGLIKQFTSTATVTINILDLNDNSPIFMPSSYTGRLKEDLPGGTTVTTVTATDRDLGSNGRVTYSMAGGALGKFRIEADTGVVHTVSQLDYETRTFYTLNISANDNGAVPRVTYVSVPVTVVDINDWTPQFQFTTYATSQLENILVDTSLLQVNASDGDGSAPNNQFVIRLTNCTPAIGLRQFYLHPATGEFKTAALLDRERWPHYDFTMTATDGGTPARTATASIIVDILDVDDNAPVFSPGRYPRLVSEAFRVGSDIVTVRATDADAGTNAELRYTISAGDPTGKFMLDNVTGLLTLVKSLDRETVDYYQLTILATDQGPPALTNTSTVAINVTDVNDNIPSFVPACNGTGLRLAVYENFRSGASVRVMSGTDRDISDNALLSYRITTIPSPSNPVPFALNRITGNLTTTAPLDREQFDEYKLTIEVSDNGTSPLSTFCNILVDVVDINDNPPVFSNKAIFSNVPEDAASFVISDVTATDADIGTNAIVTYRILSGNEQGKFAINTTSGQVTLQGRLDRENTSSYLLTVVAENTRATPVYNGTYRILVTVTDVNDNAPLFSQPVYMVNVSEFFPLSSAVLTLSASDADMGQNAALTYRIVAGNQQGTTLNVFTLANETTLVLSHQLDFETKQTFTLTVQATDNAPDVSQRRSSTATVIVNVLDENDNAPHFLKPSFAFSVLEDAGLFTDLGDVMAIDADTAIGRHITYSILAGAGASTFSIEPDNGTITLIGPLDYETMKTYTLSVVASNTLAGVNAQQGIVLSSLPVTVTVNVLDVNDNSPVFTSVAYFAGIPLQAAPPHQVITVSATDADSPPFNVVQYRLVTPLPAGTQFRIDAETGQITSDTYYAEFTQHQLELTVEASDNPGSLPSNVEFASVTVYLLDPRHRAIFVFNESASVTQTRIKTVSEWISNVTSAVIHIEQVKAHIDSVTREADSSQSDVYVYAIDSTLNKVISLQELYTIVGNRLSPVNGDQVLRHFGINILKFIGISELPSYDSTGDGGAERSITQETYFVALITVACILILVLFLIILAICCIRRRRKLDQQHQQIIWESNFFATPPASMSSVDNYQYESDDRQLIQERKKKPKKSKKKSEHFQANPIWVQPYPNRDGGEMEEEDVRVRTTMEEGYGGHGGLGFANPITTVEEREEYETGPSAVSMGGMEDNPLYESQEIKMDMFYTSDSEDEGDRGAANHFNDQSLEDLDAAGSDAQLLEAAIELEEDEGEDPLTLI